LQKLRITSKIALIIALIATTRVASLAVALAAITLAMIITKSLCITLALMLSLQSRDALRLKTQLPNIALALLTFRSYKRKL
jgi:hypothetical protein